MNTWIIQKSYGKGGMAVAFEGSEDFVEKSINFAINRLTRNVYRKCETTYIHVKKVKFYRALINEGRSKAFLNGLRGGEMKAFGKQHARNILNNARYDSFMAKMKVMRREKVFDEFSIDSF